MGRCTPIVILTILFFIGLTVTSFRGYQTLNDSLAYVDTVYVEKYNCTCLSDIDYQCVQERISKGLTMHGVECKSIEVAGEPKKYELCMYQSQRRRSNIPKCYTIENPVELVKPCRNVMCKLLGGAHLWKWAALIGVVTSLMAIASIIIFVGIKRMEISLLCWINLFTLVPSPMIAYSMMAETNYIATTWAWIMLIGFGIPLYLGWIFCFIKYQVLSETCKFIREIFEKRTIDNL